MYICTMYVQMCVGMYVTLGFRKTLTSSLNVKKETWTLASCQYSNCNFSKEEFVAGFKPDVGIIDLQLFSGPLQLPTIYQFLCLHLFLKDAYGKKNSQVKPLKSLGKWLKWFITIGNWLAVRQSLQWETEFRSCLRRDWKRTESKQICRFSQRTSPSCRTSVEKGKCPWGAETQSTRKRKLFN